MKKAFCVGIVFVVMLAASPFGLFAQQGDLNQLSRDITAKNNADRAEAYRLAALNGWATRGYGPNGSFFELQKMVNGIPAFYTTDNANAARSTNTDSTNFAIGGGSGFVLRIWDGGAPRITHQELTGRVTWNDPTVPYSPFWHATHTAGTLVASGVVAQAKGMAYAASLRAFEWTNDTGEMTSEASAGMNLSSHSYGYTRGWSYNTLNSYWYWYGDTAISDQRDYEFGFYDSEAQLVDQIANNAPNYLPVASASNDRGEGPASQPVKHYYWDSRYGNWRFSTKTRQLDGGTTGYDCIPNGMQLSKNTFTVGAVMNVPVYTGPSSVTMTTFSSWGPADDGRIKPDIVGNGWQIYSSYSTSDNSYATGSGTSMSCPNVCGSLALLEKYYKDTHGGTAMWASTLKALAIHTARECGSNPGPDYVFGWGLLNTYAAYKLLNKDYLDDSKGYIEQFTLSQGQTIEIGYRVYASTPELRATISWNDPAGSPPSPSLDPRTRMLVNDLDLRAVKGASTYYPWHLDVYNPSNAATQADNNVDNVEQVVLATPAPGVYTIRISHKGTLSGGSQKVSLVVSGAVKNHVWHVYADGSGDAPTITAAVSSAADGDSIFVHQGTYHEAGIIVGKALYIRGVDGASLTTVDGSGLGASCFIFTAVSKVIWFSDFTIKSGSSSLFGGGINCSNSSVTIDRCVIKSCRSTLYGGGMAVMSASPAVKNCTFLSNRASQNGAGLFLSSSSAVFDTCVFRGNVAVLGGGGIALVTSAPQFHNCTVDSNYAGTYGGGVYIGATGNPTLQRCIVSFGGGGGGGGIYGEPTATGATITCCDVYGNAGGNYGGSISDRTGTNNNISKDPIYCGPGAYPPVLTISSLSPCAPALSPCSQLIGALAAACLKGPDLVIASYQFTSTEPAYGDSIRATVKVKNIGQVAAVKSFYIDYYKDLASPPPAGVPGDQRHLVAGLAAGDSVTWVTAWEKATVFKEWMSYFRVDTGDSILETNEGNNLSGPIAITWQIPRQAGWPVVTGSGFHSSPAIASIDSNETTLETVIGCDNGNLYVLKSDGTNATGWPVTIGDTLFSSPAVGDITGDYHKEIVIGAKDGKIYAFNYLGTKLWEHATGSPIYRTPALADLNKDGKCEVLASSRDSLYVLTGSGHAYPGSWPYSAGGGTLTAPAVGDVDADGALEIVVVASGYATPQQSRVCLLRSNGALFNGSWPIALDTTVTADPVIGGPVSPSFNRKFYVGAANGKVYQYDVSGSTRAATTIVGTIGSSPAIYDAPLSLGEEVVVSSRLSVASPPPGHWAGMMTAIDNAGAILPGWPQSSGTWAPDGGAAPSPISIGLNREDIGGSPAGKIYSWDRFGASVYGFPIDLGGSVAVSAAADDIDRDGQIELIVASGAGGGSIHCYKLYQSNYNTSELWWPMFRHDRARTGCYGAAVPTGVDETHNTAPSATRISSIYPNPFNPSTRVAFEVSTRAWVEVSIYDVSGRRVVVLLSKEMNPGRYDVAWFGQTSTGAVAASGVYFCKLRAGNVVETRKMVLLR